MQAIEELAQTLPLQQACELFDFPRSSFYRLRQPKPSQEKSSPTQKGTAIPSRALSRNERASVRELLDSERFQDQSPREIYATLLDEGVYHCSVSTMYRILHEHDEVRERRNQVHHPAYTKPELLATAPNQLWSWDITKLRGPTKWLYYYLYVMLDIYSRYVVGWLLAEREDAELAKQLIQAACDKQQVACGQLTIHSDNGPAMIARSVAQLLDDLGVDKTHSRPYTPNDNPFSEAQFKTLKYRPAYPDRFDSLDEARLWAKNFFDWYNNQHYHTSLALLTPASVHYGHAHLQIAQRQVALSAAYSLHPERFVKGLPAHPTPPDAVWINPPTSVQSEITLAVGHSTLTTDDSASSSSPYSPEAVSSYTC